MILEQLSASSFYLEIMRKARECKVSGNKKPDRIEYDDSNHGNIIMILLYLACSIYQKFP